MLLDSDDALRIVKMDLGNLITQAKPEQKEVSLLGTEASCTFRMQIIDYKPHLRGCCMLFLSLFL